MMLEEAFAMRLFTVKFTNGYEVKVSASSVENAVRHAVMDFRRVWRIANGPLFVKEVV